MTKERFTVLYGIDENPFEWDIVDNQKNAIIKQDGITICNKLNELNDENQQLQHHLELYQPNKDERSNFDLNLCCRVNNKLRIENKELKDFKQKVFDVIDKQIAEYHQSEKDCSWGNPDRFVSYQIALIGLKEALQE